MPLIEAGTDTTSFNDRELTHESSSETTCQLLTLQETERTLAESVIKRASIPSFWRRPFLLLSSFLCRTVVWLLMPGKSVASKVWVFIRFSSYTKLRGVRQIHWKEIKDRKGGRVSQRKVIADKARVSRKY
jgi:hypothetical protein